MYNVILAYFPELLDFELHRSTKKIKYFSHDDDPKYIAIKNLLVSLLESTFVKVYEEDTEGNVLMSFNLTREKHIVYNFLPLDVKQKYHMYIAKVLLQAVNAVSNPRPSNIYDLGIHLHLGNDLQNALVCYYHFAEFLYSLGANKDAFTVFEKAFNSACELFREVLHDELVKTHDNDLKTNETTSSIVDSDIWSTSSRYSLQQMYMVCKGSNTVLHALISIIIRYGQSLINLNKKQIALRIFPLALQLFTSSRSVYCNVEHQASGDVADDETDSSDGSVLHCKSSSKRFAFETTKFILTESTINMHRKLLNQLPQFGTFREQLDTVLVIISGILMSVIEPGTCCSYTFCYHIHCHHYCYFYHYHIIVTILLLGYRNQAKFKLSERMHSNTLNGVMKMCRGKYSDSHYVRFANLKIWYIVHLNAPDMMHQMLPLIDESYSMYKFENHSTDIINKYGSDRGLETIVIGTSSSSSQSFVLI